MITVKEARNLLNTLNTFTPVGFRRGNTARLLALIESEGFEFPPKFTEAIEEAAAIIKNLNTVQADGQPNLLEVAADPKKLRSELDNIARRNALSGQVRNDTLSALMIRTTSAVVSSIPDIMDQFIARYKDEPAYATTGATPGEAMLAQEKRGNINSVHDNLITAGAGWTRPDSSDGFWLRWHWTPEQWAQIPVAYPNWEVPSVDQAALSLGATHRFARSLEQAQAEAEECMDLVAEIERKAKQEGANPWSDTFVPVYAD